MDNENTVNQEITESKHLFKVGDKVYIPAKRQKSWWFRESGYYVVQVDPIWTDRIMVATEFGVLPFVEDDVVYLLPSRVDCVGW